MVLVAAAFPKSSAKSPLSSGHSRAEKAWDVSLHLGLVPPLMSSISPSIFVSTSVFSNLSATDSSEGCLEDGWEGG